MKRARVSHHDDDGILIWVASYPKSGNTWLRLAMAAALNRGHLSDLDKRTDIGYIASSRSWYDLSGDTGFSDLLPEEVERLRPLYWASPIVRNTKRPTLVKIHDQRRTPSGIDLIPEETTRAIIHLVRDPRDIAISWAHHGGRGIDEAIAQMADPEFGIMRDPIRIGSQLPQWLGTWSDHCLSWLEGRPPEPLLLRYEDRLTDPAGTLAQALNFSRIEADEKIVDTATKGTTFEHLQAMEQTTGFSGRQRGATRPFFGEGRAGAWREVLSKRQITRIETDHGPMMARLGYS